MTRKHHACALLITLGGCSALRPLSSARATDVARRNVCGTPNSTSDTACTVLSTERIRGGYRVLLDRRPPAGNDRLAIDVLNHGDRIDVSPRDSAATTKPR
jgi:hypothetical protein